jgi:hypothetical protein
VPFPDPRTTASDLRLAERAFRDHYPIDGATRQFVVAQALALAQKSLSPRVRLAALRVLLAADSLNERRERNADGRRSEEVAAAAASLRAVLASSEGREFVQQAVEQLGSPNTPGKLGTREAEGAGQTPGASSPG